MKDLRNYHKVKHIAKKKKIKGKIIKNHPDILNILN